MEWFNFLEGDFTTMHQSQPRSRSSKSYVGQSSRLYSRKPLVPTLTKKEKQRLRNEINIEELIKKTHKETSLDLPQIDNQKSQRGQRFLARKTQREKLMERFGLAQDFQSLDPEQHVQSGNALTVVRNIQSGNAVANKKTTLNKVSKKVDHRAVIVITDSDDDISDRVLHSVELDLLFDDQDVAIPQINMDDVSDDETWPDTARGNPTKSKN
jgi:hypothetical protein